MLVGAACLLRALRLASAADAQLLARPVIALMQSLWKGKCRRFHDFSCGAGDRSRRSEL